MYRIGIDVGGTFTDFFVYNEKTQEVWVVKTSSTPKDPAEGVLEGLRKSGVNPREIMVIIHGSTVGTNALITRNLPPTALITTKNFKDVVEIGRGVREDIWDAYKDKVKPYIKGRNRLEVEEEVDYAGNVRIPLNEKEAREVCRILKRRGIESVAVVFINSYMNSENEFKMKKIIEQEMPGVNLCVSAEILPEIFEHERVSTTMINACLSPVVSKYLYRLVDGLKKMGYEGDVLVVHSGGGVMTAETIAYYASRIANSGPCAGAIAGAYIAKELSGIPNAVSLDMGGTSADISLMYNGNMRMTKEWWVEFGYPIMFPNIEIISIGAGGGSVAWIDEGGSLRIGPLSQGADPGPACYMKGGDKPTLTDAYLVLNRLTPLLAGETKLNRERAEEVIKEHIADKLNLGVADAAHAIVQIANAYMADAVRLICIRKGYDPREFAFVAFGGAGPLHAVDIAKELGFPKVIIPPWPGVSSATGCLLTDIRHDISKTFIADLATVDLSSLEKSFQEMEDEALERLRAERIREDRMQLLRYLDLRYVGQWRSLTIPISRPLPKTLEDVRDQFHREHLREYAYSAKEQSVDIYGIRVTGVGIHDKPKLPQFKREGEIEDSLIGRRKVYSTEAKGFIEADIYQHERLPPGASFSGPAVIQYYDSTAYIPGGYDARVDEYRNIIIDVK